MLIGQVSCDADPIVTTDDTAVATIVAVAGIVSGFLTPMFIAHGTNVPRWILNWAKKEPQITTIKREADAKVAAWLWSVAAIVTASVTTLCISTNEILTGIAASSLMGSLLSLHFTHGV
jgi:hypothetical protein